MSCSDKCNGLRGPRGCPGERGKRGKTGIGETGPTGPSGSSIGATGSTGPTGPDGARGITGPDGAQGITGPDGAQGITGPDGAQGPTGPDGARGITGPDGAQGSTGPDGAQGSTGPDGAQGSTGPDGAQGSTGPLGIQGPQGITGPDGSSITGGNYTWAYLTNVQLVSAAATFDTIIFNNIPQLSGWTYNGVTGKFTAAVTGTFIVDYTVLGSDSGVGVSYMSVRGFLGIGIQVFGSAITLDLQSSSSVVLFDNSFIMNITAGDTFELQFAGSTNTVEVNNASIPAVAGESPVFASLIITRIA